MRRRWWLFVVAGAASPAIVAGDITIATWESDAHHVVLAPLRASFAVHARAASAWLLGGTWAAPPGARALDRFEEQLLDATFASLHYTFEKDGKSSTRVYHAMSGAVVPWPVPGMTPNADIGTYIRLRAGEAWAHAVAGERTAIEASPLGDAMPIDIYTASAEYKAIRSVERDIDAGLVPRAGRAVFFTSRTPCQVCEAALRYFARRYTTSLHVHHLADPGTVVAQRFVRERRAYLSTLRVTLSPAGPPSRLTVPSSGGPQLRCPAVAPAQVNPT